VKTMDIVKRESALPYTGTVSAVPGALKLTVN
jgi:hypothetical protein